MFVKKKKGLKSGAYIHSNDVMSGIIAACWEYDLHHAHTQTHMYKHLKSRLFFPNHV